LNDSFAKSNEILKREIILRSAFPGIYGNYYAKYGILLSCMSHFGKLHSKILLLGESGTGKSIFVSGLNRLFQGQMKILMGLKPINHVSIKN